MRRLLFLVSLISTATVHAQTTGANSSNYDVTYYKCVWNIDPARLFIAGSVTTYFTPTQPLQSIELDASGIFFIDSVVYHLSKILFTVPRRDVMALQFPHAITSLDSVTIFYHGIPDGLAFSIGTHGTNNTPMAWSFSELYGAKSWWPCKETLTDKADSLDIYIIVPKGNKAASNGLLKEVVASGDQLSYHWRTRYPIATYLVCAAVSNYSEYTLMADLQNGPVPVQYFTFPEDSISSRATAKPILSIFHFYDSLFGPYPFEKEKYGHVQTMGGGMENQTMTFVGSFDLRLLSHELAHSWFGDKVTCGSWSDIWLNEGFAKYCEYLSLGYADDPLLSRQWLQMISDAITSLPDGSVYVTDTTNTSHIFDYRLSYFKGAYVLHMLRWKLGDEAFFSGIRSYLNDPQLTYSFARTSVLQQHFEKVSGQSLTDFFDQWFYGEGYPSYTVFYSQDNDDVEVNIQQSTSHPSVPFFEMPLPILFKGAKKDSLVVFNQVQPLQTFHINLDFFVHQISIDPDLHVLSAHNVISYETEDIVVYPNPAADVQFVKVKDSQNGNRVEVFNALGQKLNDFTSTENIFVIPLGGLSPGVYFLQISSDTKVFRQKIVKGR